MIKNKRETNDDIQWTWSKRYASSFWIPLLSFNRLMMFCGSGFPLSSTIQCIHITNIKPAQQMEGIWYYQRNVLATHRWLATVYPCTANLAEPSYCALHRIHYIFTEDSDHNRALRIRLKMTSPYLRGGCLWYTETQCRDHRKSLMHNLDRPLKSLGKLQRETSGYYLNYQTKEYSRQECSSRDTLEHYTEQWRLAHNVKMSLKVCVASE